MPPKQDLPFPIYRPGVRETVGTGEADRLVSNPSVLEALWIRQVVEPSEFPIL